MPEVQASRQLQTIQVGRGLAALAIVFYHTSLLFEQRADLILFDGAGGYGYMGVPFFFVLSGFIIGHAHFADLGRPDRLPPFVRKRFLRVYPVYWVLSALFVCAAISGMGEPDFSYAPAEFVQAHLLIHVTPNFGPPPLKVAWTLFYEIRFYLLFALAIAYPRPAMVLACVWGFAIATLSPWNDLSAEWLSYWNLAFPLGLMACLLFRSGAAGFGSGYVWLGSVAIMAVVCATPIPAFHGGRSLPMLAMMAGFAVLILGLALLERQRAFCLPRGLMFLGDASYSLYLAHSAAIAVAGSVIIRFDVLDSVSAELLYLPIVAFAVMGGISAHLVIERPLIAAMNSRRASAPRLSFSETALEGSNPGSDPR
ncbi:acyltransferase family protein [Novosphingobium aquimarinum]|uniref:acyltransferase family protein n=1 Tax=Novosphingobium aquimarinum TaxID=2682494 RepID=UPI0018DE49AA|nr:acyltransferase [Novosphingobium aquimarinum]